MTRWRLVVGTLCAPKGRLVHSVSADVGGKALVFKSGHLARMADGCVEARAGETSLLVTVVGRQRSSPAPFMPLTVDYKNRASAYGRIPGNFLRREVMASDADVLTGRLIDRSVRSCFTKECYGECQVVCSLIAHDGQNDADALAVNATSAALMCSPLPWRGPVAAVKVAADPQSHHVIVNPSIDESSKCPFSLILTANESGSIVMLEGGGDAVDHALLSECIRQALQACEPIFKALQSLRASVGQEKRPELEHAKANDSLVVAIKQLAQEELSQLFGRYNLNKTEVDQEISNIRQRVCEGVKEHLDDGDQFDQAFTELVRSVLRERLFQSGRRRDGRSPTCLRPINCQVDLYQPLHGSALFQRGQSQVLSTVTLDSRHAAFKGDVASVLGGLSAREKKFMLQYTFSPFATNEIATGRTTNRREMGHGALAEKALRSIVPQDFPFTIRLTADVLESNGSTSMGSVCAGSMALMDSGVPVRGHVAGVAVGLMTKGDRHLLLTDITGMEDFFGDMDFKIASCRSGVTALQMDTKLAAGVPVDIVDEALRAGLAANELIMAKMDQCVSKARDGFKANGPAEEILKVPLAKRAQFLGAGGLNVKRVEAETGAQIVQVDENEYSVFLSDGRRMEQVKKMVERLLVDNYEQSLEFGSIVTVRIVELRDSGALVQLHPSMANVFVANSQLDTRRVSHPSKLGLEVGQELCVKYFGRDPSTGAVRLSRRVLLQAESTRRLNLMDTSKSASTNPWSTARQPATKG